MIQTILKERGLSIYWLSKASGVPYTTVSLLCRGKTSPERCDAGTVLRIAKALGVTVEELLRVEVKPLPDHVNATKPVNGFTNEINE